MASQRKLAASDGRELAQPGSEKRWGRADRATHGKRTETGMNSARRPQDTRIVMAARSRLTALQRRRDVRVRSSVSIAFCELKTSLKPFLSWLHERIRTACRSPLSCLSGPSLSPSSGSDVPLPSSASSRSVARAGSHGALSPHPAASSPSAELSLQQRFAVAQEALTALPGGAALYLFLHLLSRHSPSTLAKTVASCVRKTEPTLAPLVLFPLLGSPPATYFEDAMKRQLLHTASIYLLVLQNTEGCLVVRQKRALPLLRAALRLGVAGLARKLVRFVLALLVAYPARKRAENSACEATGDPTESAKARQASVHALREGNCEEDIVVPWSGAGGAPALWAPPALFQERRRSRSHAARSRAEEKPAREGEQLHSQVEEEEGSRRAQKAKHGQRAEERAERQADAKADEERAIFQLYRDVVAIVEDCLLSSLVHLQWLRVFSVDKCPRARSACLALSPPPSYLSRLFA
ncbi:RIC1 protein [Besnoitia besnoiti]|uniref:RIC1 protein n=1 Tax=Besnoitia besnoiti TaxID=94643 RepID=A0A2A9M942_BESBE|nr:RIC1 protein [Besnoitia besnoiti]PFH34409.1 RIC1 protein [Besnoitia besnoiti]